MVDVHEPQPAAARLGVQVSPDGTSWCEAGSVCLHPASRVMLAIDDPGTRLRWVASGITSASALYVRLHPLGRPGE